MVKFDEFDGTEPERLGEKGPEALALSYVVAALTRDTLGAAVMVEALQTFWTAKVLGATTDQLMDGQKIIGDVIVHLHASGKKEFANTIAKAKDAGAMLDALLKPEGKA